jgi:hypothetical protein
MVDGSGRSHLGLGQTLEGTTVEYNIERQRVAEGVGEKS